MSCIQQNTNQNLSTEEYLKLQAQIEDQIDYQFIQRIIQEVTQSCAMPLPIPASAIPPLIYQAASYFWENYDFAVEERYYCLKNTDLYSSGNPHHIQYRFLYLYIFIFFQLISIS